MYSITILFGNVGDEPEVTRDGSRVTSVTLRLRTNRHGTTEWHTLMFAGRVAELVAARVAAGDLRTGAAMSVVGSNHTTQVTRRTPVGPTSSRRTVVMVERFMLDASPVSLGDLPSPD